MTDLKTPDRLIRINSIVGKNGILPISKATFFAGVKKGYYPQPSPKISPNVTTWFYKDIIALIENGYNQEVE